MNIKMRFVNSGGYTKIENKSVIREVMINEDFLHPKSESIAVCFKSGDASGIIELTIGEFDKLKRTIERKTHLIKGMGKV